MADADQPAGGALPARTRTGSPRGRSTTYRCARSGPSSTALNYVKDDIDTTLAFRWSCRMGICGSCGMNVNGEPRLTCATFLSDYAPGPVRVEPLGNFPVVRDLVVDIDRLHGEAAHG